MDFHNTTSNQFLMVSEDDLKNFLLKFLAEYSQKEAPKIWISTTETMELLQIKSKTSLQKLRNTGAVEFSQPMKKIILYKYESIMEYLEKYSQKTF